MSNLQDNSHRRTVNSFVRRMGRWRPSQKLALDALWPDYGLESAKNAQPYDFATLFSNDNPVILEIGFGMGDNLVALAKQNPNQNYIGIEVHLPGVGRVLASSKQNNLSNLKVFKEDAKIVLSSAIANNSLQKCYILFPDPWHKKRHNKRRLIQVDFLDLIAKKLQTNGEVQIATDWKDYAEHIDTTFNQHPSFTNRFGLGNFAPVGMQRVATKFEQRGLRLGHKIYEYSFVKS